MDPAVSIRLYEQILSGLLGTTATVVFDVEFKKAIGKEVDDFKDKESLKCSYATRDKTEYFIRCKTCLIDERSCMCIECFFSNKEHIEKNHEFEIFDSDSASCDCGNEHMKVEGYCEKHRVRDVDSHNINTYLQVDEDTRKLLHSHIRGLIDSIYKSLVHHSKALVEKELKTKEKDEKMKRKFEDGIDPYKIEEEEELEEEEKPKEEIMEKDEIIRLVKWLVGVITNSAVMTHVVAEELMCQLLDRKTNKTRELYSVVPHPYHDGVDPVGKPLLSQLILDKEFLLSTFVPLIDYLLDNHSLFYIVFLEHYIKLYPEIHRTRDTRSGEVMRSFISFYPPKNITAFATCPNPNNMLTLILECQRYHMTLIKEYLLRKATKSITLQSDFYVFCEFMENPVCVDYLMASQPLQQLFMDCLVDFHNIYPGNTSTENVAIKAVHQMESIIIETVLNMLKASKDKDGLVKLLIDLVVTASQSLSQLKMHERFGVRLVRENFFIQFQAHETPFFMPLYRVLGALMMQTDSKHLPYLVEKLETTGRDWVVHALTFINIFRNYFGTYDSDNKQSVPGESIFTDFTIRIDHYLQQLFFVILGSNHFFLIIFDIITSFGSMKATSMYEIFGKLMDVLQYRGRLEPTINNIQPILVQLTLSQSDTKLLYPLIPTPLYNEEIVVEATKQCINENGEVKADCLDLYNPYFQFFQLKYVNSLRIRTSDSYLKAKGLKEEQFPIPCRLTEPLSPYLESLYNIFKDSSFLDLIYCCLLGTLYPNYLEIIGPSILQPTLRLMIIEEEAILSNYSLYVIAFAIRDCVIDWNDIRSNVINYLIPSDINDNNSGGGDTDSSPIQFGVNLIYNLIKKVKVGLPGKEDRVELSTLDLLCEFWQKMIQAGEGLEKKELLTFIFKSLIEKEPTFKTYLLTKSVDIDDNNEGSADKQDEEEKYKKRIQEMKEKSLQAMKLQQLQFLEKFDEDYDEDEDKDDDEKDIEEEDIEESKDEEIKIDEADKSVNQSSPISISSPTLGSPSLQGKSPMMGGRSPNQHHHPSSPSSTYEPCIICKLGPKSSNQELFAIGYIELTTLLNQDLFQRKIRLLEDNEHSKEYLIALNDIVPEKTGSTGPLQTDSIEDHFKFFNSHLHSYVSSCFHNVHFNCISSKTSKELGYFLCPLCSQPSNVIIPLTVRPIKMEKDEENEKDEKEEEEKEDEEELKEKKREKNIKLQLSTISKYDVGTQRFFKTMSSADIQDENLLTTIYRPLYMMRFVVENVQILELKSRMSRVYAIGKEYYFMIKPNDFDKEVKTLQLLVSAVKLAPQLEEKIPIDNFILGLSTDTFMLYALSCLLDTPQNQIKLQREALNIYICKFLVHEILKTKKDDETRLTLEYLMEMYDLLMEMEPMSLLLRDYIYPFLRQMFLFNQVINNKNISVTRDQLANYGWLTAEMGLPEDEMELIKKCCQFKYFAAQYLIVSLLIPNQVIYPPPPTYSNLPTFQDLPKTLVGMVQVMTKSCKTCAHCNKILKAMCISCGKRLCLDTECMTQFHYIQCSTPHTAYFCLDTRSILVFDQMFGRNRQVSDYQIYLEENDQEIDRKASNFISTTATLSTERLRQLYIYWFNRLNAVPLKHAKTVKPN